MATIGKYTLPRYINTNLFEEVDVDIDNLQNANIKTLSAAENLTNDSVTLCYFGLTGSDQDVKLPTTSVTTGKRFLIYNTNTTGLYKLIVKESTTTIITLYPQQCCVVYFNGSNWLLSENFLNIEGRQVSRLTQKINLADKDEFLIEDSADNYKKKKVYAKHIGTSSHKEVYKNTDETRISNITLTDDGALYFAIDKNENWHVKIRIIIEDENALSGNIGLRYRIDIPTGAVITNGTLIAETSENTALMFSQVALNMTEATGLYLATEAGSQGFAEIDFWVSNGENAGNVKFQWAQNSNLAYNLNILKGSWLKASISL